MLKRPGDFETAQSATYGTVAKLPAGGHGCMIHKAEVVTVGEEHIVQLHIYFDIAEHGEYDGFYKAKFENGKKWGTPTWQGIFKQRVYGADESTTNPYFKGLITAIEESNPGYKWNWDEKSLAGKRIGFIFREEEFLSTKGEVLTTVRPAWACGYDGANEIEAPTVKKLDPSKLPANIAHPELTPANEEKLPWES